MKPIAFATITFFTLASSPSFAQTASPNVNPLTGEGVSLGGILFPTINFQTTFGTSTGEPAELLSGHHDPDRKGFTVQALEFGLGAKLHEHITLFGNYALKVDLDDKWEGAFEEYYATITGLPAGATMRGGRFLTKFGAHNENHTHAFVMADQHIANGRFLGDDALALEGAEISLPILRSLPAGWEDRFTIATGRVANLHSHEHSHGEDEHEESEFEAEGSLLRGWTTTAHYGLTYAASSRTLHTAGLSGAWGANRYGRRTHIYGANYEYLWRADGALDRTGHRETSEFFQWRTELFLRHAGAVASEHHDEEESHSEEHHEEHEEDEDSSLTRRDFTDFAAYSVLTYGFPTGKWQTHLRGEYASGNADAGLPERWRVSPAVTWIPSEQLPVNLKLQYNFDHSPSFGDEHSVWLQFNLVWGSGCAHAH